MFALGAISNTGLEEHVAKLKETNPLICAILQRSRRFQFNGSFKALVIMLVFVAAFKGLWLFFSRYASQILAIRVSRDPSGSSISSTSNIASYELLSGAQHGKAIFPCRQQCQSNFTSLIPHGNTSRCLHVLTSLTLCFFHSWQLSL